MNATKPFEGPPSEVLQNYPAAIAGASWTALGNAGGYSGARLWKGETNQGLNYCLRAWPVRRMTEDSLRLIHLAQRSLDLPIVSVLVETLDGATWVQRGEQFWEVQSWLPGTATFHLQPSDTRLFAAIRALASIHEQWQPVEPRSEPCRAVGRMITACRDWRRLVQSGWKPDYGLPYPYEIHERARRAWSALLGGILTAEFALFDWTSRPLPIQLCLCDVWHDHILYEGDTVTGVIDLGSVKLDSVAVDLARMLGSMIPDDEARMRQALAVYSALRPVPQTLLELVPVIDRAGIVVGLSNWLRWLYLEQRAYLDVRSVARRMDVLLRRAELKRPMLLPWAG